MKHTQGRRLGRTSLSVTSMGLGGAPLGNLFAELADAEAHDTVTRAWQEGIRLFDTAPFYGHGDSERRMGEVLREYGRDGFVLSTKVGRLLEPCPPDKVDGGQFAKTLPFRPVFDYSYDGVMRSFEDSLQRIATPRIDILFAHDLDAWTHGDEAARDVRVREFMEGGYRALVELRDQGAVTAIGAGLNEWQACEFLARQGDFDCFLLAGRYTLLEQEALATFLPLCEERGIGIIVGGPYNTGILATGAVEGATYDYAPAAPEIMKRVGEIEAVCVRHGVGLASAALQFPLGHPAVAAVIPGARTPAEVAINVETFGREIPADLWAELKAKGLLRPDAPTP